MQWGKTGNENRTLAGAGGDMVREKTQLDGKNNFQYINYNKDRQ